MKNTIKVDFNAYAIFQKMKDMLMMEEFAPKRRYSIIGEINDLTETESWEKITEFVDQLEALLMDNQTKAKFIIEFIDSNISQ
ncbi:MAG: hypothetical protein LBI36_06605 [Oscillospiraceae bacterium]|jgi:hypothetical protein|nr:hypothetical protein [Oscillospiraceae bacterium]